MPRGRWLLWDKLDGREAWDSFGDLDIAWHSRSGPFRMFRYLWKGVARRKDPRDGVRRSHVSQKPVPLMEWCIDQAAVPAGGVVCDPYMGSGSTGVAAVCKAMGFIGIDIVREHCRTAARRIDAAINSQFSILNSKGC